MLSNKSKRELKLLGTSFLEPELKTNWDKPELITSSGTFTRAEA